MRNLISISQPVSIRWLLLICTLVSLSACSSDEEESPSQLVNATTEDQALNKWIVNYLQEVVSEDSASPVPPRKPQTPKIALESAGDDPVDTDSLALGYLSWIEESADSTQIIAEVVYALPDSLVQQLSDTLSNAELVIDLSVSSASESTSNWLSSDDANNALQHAALGPIAASSLTTPFLVTLPGTFSQQGLPIDRKVDVERLVIPLKLVH